MTIQRYRDEYSGCEADPEGEYVRYDDLVEFKAALLQAIDNTYRDMYDSDDYVNGKIDVEDKVQAAFNNAGIK